MSGVFCATHGPGDCSAFDHGCAACAAAPIGQACSLEHAELVRDVLSLTAGRGEAEDGPDSTGEPSRRASHVLARSYGRSACDLCRSGLSHVVADACYELGSE